MILKQLTVILFSLFVVMSCSKSYVDHEIQLESIYFPPIYSDTWETKSITELNWNESELQPLLDYLEDKNSKSFILLHNGKIVFNHYFTVMK